MLPREAEAEFHGAGAAVEGGFGEERRRGDEDVAGVEWVCIGVSIDGAVVGGQADAWVAVVEGVVGRQAELDRGALVQFVAVEERHVPDVKPGGVDGVAARVGDSADSRLYEAGGWVRGD